MQQPPHWHLKILKKIADAARDFHLDFDDAYQYAVAERYGLLLVSFDRDFDQTKKGRVEPKDLFLGR